MSGTQQRLQELRARREAAQTPGGAEAETRQHGKGKLTARERLDLLLDPGSFTEYDQLAVHRSHDFGMQERRPPGDGVLTGAGAISGRPVFVFSQDATVFGGSLGEVFAEKVVKLMDKALRYGIPLIGINDSGGARIQEGVVSLAGYADIFYRNVQGSGVIPQISIVAGPCAGGAVYSPAITDFIVMVEGTGQMFITGPEVTRAVTGEEVSMEDLGGALTHNTISGVAHFLAEGEQQAAQLVRALYGYLPLNNLEPPPFLDLQDPAERADDSLQEVIPDNPNAPYDMHAVLRSVLDRDSWLEVHAHFALNLICGFGRLAGEVVGVVANQPSHLAGALDIDSSVKGARFIRFCDAFNIPLLTFVDVPGFLPGSAQERGGIIRHGAKLLYAFAEATVPKLTVITRKAYGGAYDVMNSKHIGADLNLAWPNAEIAVMGPQAAVAIVNRREIAQAADPAARLEEMVADYRAHFATPYIAAERGYLDAVIEPRETRLALSRGLQLARGKRVSAPPRRHGNIPL